MDALCTAHTQKGDPCSAKGKSDCEGLCKIHYNQLQRNRDQQRIEREAEEARVQERRARILQQNQRRIDEAPTGCADNFHRFARLIADLWVTQRVDGDLLARVYCLIRRTPVGHSQWPPFMRAVVKLINLTYFNPDNHNNWIDIPPEQKMDAIATLTETAQLLPNQDVINVLKPDDKVRLEFIRRQNEFAEAQRLAREAARIAIQQAEQQARNAEFNRQQREGPMVFRRDPEGVIDLKAFGVDRESVHRSSVQDATQKAVNILIRRTIPDDMETLVEITLSFTDTTAVRFRPAIKDQALMVLTDDYYNTVAFGQSYGDILNRVWAYIRTHSERGELVRRLSQEIVDGIGPRGTGVCVNGKMTHLVNILYSYDEEITAVMQNEAPSREAFQAKFATLLNLPVNERKVAAVDIFNDYRIPEAERDEWLNPMLAE